MKFDYEGWLKTAKERLEELYQQREDVDREITALQRGIEGFSPLVKREVPWRQESVGMTEAVTKVFAENPSQLMTPVQVRDVMRATGIELKQENPLANIHQTIARLIARGFVRPYMMDGRTFYRYDPELAKQEQIMRGLQKVVEDERSGKSGSIRPRGVLGEALLKKRGG
jgi:hypothetical protein